MDAVSYWIYRFYVFPTFLLIPSFASSNIGPANSLVHVLSSKFSRSNSSFKNPSPNSLKQLPYKWYES